MDVHLVQMFTKDNIAIIEITNNSYNDFVWLKKILIKPF